MRAVPDAHRASTRALRGEVLRAEGRVDDTLGAVTLVAETVRDIAIAEGALPAATPWSSPQRASA